MTATAIINTLPTGCTGAINTPELHREFEFVSLGKFASRFGFAVESKEWVTVAVLAGEDGWDDDKQCNIPVWDQYYFPNRADAVAFAQAQASARVTAYKAEAFDIAMFEMRKMPADTRWRTIPDWRQGEEIWRTDD